MAFAGLDSRNDMMINQTEAGQLGPGSYDPKPSFGANSSPKRKAPRRGGSIAFGSSQKKEINTLDGKQYSPGPGFYNFNKYKSSFAIEFMKSEQDNDSYYLIQNGTLLRKT